MSTMLLRRAQVCVVRPQFRAQLRLASSKQPIKLAPKTSPTVAPATAPRYENASSPRLENDALNAPLSTLPPPLELPVRAPETSTFSHLFTTGKAYLTFFKSGLKAVYTNFTLSRAVQDTIDQAPYNASVRAAALAGAITRAQYQLLMRSRHDNIRVPAFIVIFIVCGEMSPFVLPFVPGLVPGTCRPPGLVEKTAKKWEAAVEAGWGKEGQVARVLGVEPRWVKALRERRVRKRVEYLEIDDVLVEKAGGWEGLRGGEELRRAVGERGMRVRGRGEEELRGSLRRWEGLRRGGVVGAGLWERREGEWEKMMAEMKREKK